jgi:malto-oligosyltrehalose trehalohydrolase
MTSTTRFAHQMPFGANVIADGSTHFRLWAPKQSAVSVVLEDTQTTIPMDRGDDGWFEAATDKAPPGTPYRYQLEDGFRVPDPASRCQADDAHGHSLVYDPFGYSWQKADWRGRPWHETTLYELHTGTFSPEGTFDGIRERLDHFERLGITAIELMPVADFPGRRNWGYDGVLMFAPDRAYGSPEDLKRLIDEAHARDIMVFLDVVYNHFGPDGNYLHLYAPTFFTDRFETPWGAAIDFSVRQVRDFYIGNAVYWLEEYRFDGLRFDAVHAILDDSPKHILTELAETVRQTLPEDRHVHLVLENDANEARFLKRSPAGGVPHFTAQWNDDYHHVQHVLLTGEEDGYYEDFTERRVDLLGRALTQGFVYQGEPSAHRGGEPRGEPSADLPPAAFVNFIQNHDQIGNRAFGERLTTLAEKDAVRAATAALLLAPQVPMIYMGEEWGSEEPFTFFCDFHDELADAVRDGRRREFAKFEQFAKPAVRERIPDPNADATFEAARINWPADDDPNTNETLGYYAALLRLRREQIVPRLAHMPPRMGSWLTFGETGLSVTWSLGDGTGLALITNLGETEQTGCAKPQGLELFESRPGLAAAAADGRFPAWSTAWFVTAPPHRG